MKQAPVFAENGVTYYPAMFAEVQKEGQIVCRLCPHFCQLRPGQTGVCRVRHHLGGQLVTSAYGQTAMLAVEPIEKKYFFHFLPGSQTLSLGTPGCNLGCKYCINWRVSQTGVVSDSTQSLSPAQVVDKAINAGVRVIAFTYTEPTIFFEYARDIARLARQAGLAVVAKSNGYMTTEVLKEMAQWLDGINIDLKGWTKKEHAQMVGGDLDVVLNSMRQAKRLGLWLEVSSLLVPNLNTRDSDLYGMANFIANELGVDTPWHLLRYFPNYLLTERPPTAQAELETAVRIAREVGLRYLYNRELRHGEQWQTVCTHCRTQLIQREGFVMVDNRVGENGRCGQCDTPIAGVF